jgi:hypothetical protein
MPHCTIKCPQTNRMLTLFCPTRRRTLSCPSLVHKGFFSKLSASNSHSMQSKPIVLARSNSTSQVPHGNVCIDLPRSCESLPCIIPIISTSLRRIFLKAFAYIEKRLKLMTSHSNKVFAYPHDRLRQIPAKQNPRTGPCEVHGRDHESEEIFS